MQCTLTRLSESKNTDAEGPVSVSVLSFAMARIDSKCGMVQLWVEEADLHVSN